MLKPLPESFLYTAVFLLFLLLFSPFVGAGAEAAGSRPAPRGSANARPAVVVDLRSFGAVGDGVVDDGPALQSALDSLAQTAAGGDATLLVPEGRYAIVTPVSKDFAGVINSLTIVGPTPVPVPESAGPGRGLGLSAEFVIKVGSGADALALTGIESLLVQDMTFIGDPSVGADARIVLAVSEVGSATVRHCEFYGLASLVASGSIISAHHSHLKLEDSAFLGSTATTGFNTSVVQNTLWRGITISGTRFIDYGNRPDYYSKTPYAAPFSWISIGNAAPHDEQSTWREASIRDVFLDEGAYIGITCRPDLFAPWYGGGAPIDLVHISGLQMNVSNLYAHGIHVNFAERLVIERSKFGWSHNADTAMYLENVGEAIIDQAECVADATTIRARTTVGRLDIVNSIYQTLDSNASVTNVINTAPDEDPVQYVRQRYIVGAGREADAAGLFYWASQILRCGSDAQCVTQSKLAFENYLDDAPPAIHAISGRVTNADGSALSGIEIKLSGTQDASFLTDSDGNFRFSSLPTSGVYTLPPTHPHYTFTPSSQTFALPDGDRVADFSATLKRFTIRGTVTNYAFHPMAGVTVTLSGSQAGATTTDAGGVYVFADVPAGGDYTVTPVKVAYIYAAHPTGLTSETYTSLSSDKHTFFTGTPIRLDITGKITTTDGAGLGGVTVSLSGAQTGSMTTDAGGNYSFNVTADRNYTVTATLANYSFTPTSLPFDHITQNERGDFTAELKTFTISGRATQQNSQPLGGVTVTLSGSQSGTTTTAADGTYSFSLKAGGTYTLTPSQAGYLFIAHPSGQPSQTFSAIDGDRALNFTGRSEQTINGKVTTAGGSALGGVAINLSGAQVGATTTDAGGNYSLVLPVSGSYTLTPSKTDYVFTPQSLSFDNLSADETANFTAAENRSSLNGRVTNDSGDALSGVSVSLSGTRSATATTGPDGTYSFDALPNGGSYTVTASKTNHSFTPSSRMFNNLESDQVADFTGALLSYRIGGRITDGGVGLADVSVALSGTQTGSATTDTNGDYSFNVTAEGSYTLTPSKRHYTFSAPSLTFNHLGGDQTANFAATINLHTVGGRVAKSDGTPIAGVTVTLSHSQTSSAATTDAGGNYSFPNLPAGSSYTLTPSKPNYVFTQPSGTLADLSTSETVNFTGALASHTVSGRITLPDGVGLGGVTITLDGSQTGTALSDSAGNYLFTLPAEGNYTFTPSKTNYTFAPSSKSFTLLDSNQSANFSGSLFKSLQFSAATQSVTEGAGSVKIMVMSTGDTSTEIDVDYASSGGTARPGLDVNTIVGTLHFAPGETSKALTIFITDDAHVEGQETITINLSDPTNGAVLGGPSTLTLTIADNDAAPSPANAIDDAQFFVRQHYVDFLGREPDAAGLAFWTNQITSCGANPSCLDARRMNVSAAFFLSPEFQTTGYFVQRLYAAAYGRAPRRVEEFLPSVQSVGRDVVGGADGWELRLEQNKVAFVDEFVREPQFAAAFPADASPAAFVGLLDANTGNSLTAEERAAVVEEFGGASTSADAGARARVLRKVAENRLFYRREFDRAFVLMQYFAYLQRNPDDAPDDDFDGYNFWLRKLNEHGGDYQAAEMVRSFIISAEYRQRFGR